MKIENVKRDASLDAYAPFGGVMAVRSVAQAAFVRGGLDGLADLAG